MFIVCALLENIAGENTPVELSNKPENCIYISTRSIPIESKLIDTSIAFCYSVGSRWIFLTVQGLGSDDSAKSPALLYPLSF